MAKNLRLGADWVPAIVVEQLGPLTYLVGTCNDQLLWKCHIDLLKELSVRNRTEEAQDTMDSDVPATYPETADVPLGAESIAARASYVAAACR